MAPLTHSIPGKCVRVLGNTVDKPIWFIGNIAIITTNYY